MQCLNLFIQSRNALCSAVPLCFCYSVLFIYTILESVGQYYCKCIFVRQNYVFREKAKRQAYLLASQRYVQQDFCCIHM